jgi:hypothetical protein
MASRKKLWKMAMFAAARERLENKKEKSEKIIKTVKEVFENTVDPEPIVEKVLDPEPIVEKVLDPAPIVEEVIEPVFKPKPKTRKRTSRTKKTIGV